MENKQIKKKFDELSNQIQGKKCQIEKLNIEIEALNEKIKFLTSIDYDEVQKKTNKIKHKYFLRFMANDFIFLFGYCDNVIEKDGLIEIVHSDVIISKCLDRISYSENITSQIDSKEYFNNIMILDGQQSKIIQDEIDKTIHHEQTVKGLYQFVFEFFKFNMI